MEFLRFRHGNCVEYSTDLLIISSEVNECQSDKNVFDLLLN